MGSCFTAASVWRLSLWIFTELLEEKVWSQKLHFKDTLSMCNASMWSFIFLKFPSFPHTLQEWANTFCFLPFGIKFWLFVIMDFSFSSCSCWLLDIPLWCICLWLFISLFDINFFPHKLQGIEIWRKIMCFLIIFLRPSFPQGLQMKERIFPLPLEM